MLKSMSMHKKNYKRKVKSNFVKSCLTFKSSIPHKEHIPITNTFPS